MSGLILVFDLDETLVDRGNFYKELQLEQPDINLLNLNLINNVIGPAVELREQKRGVDAIVILTNNSFARYIDKVCNLICKYLKKDEGTVFDKVVTGNRGEHKKKSLEEIKAMGIEYGDDASLCKRIYFFDDSNTHILIRELSENGYPKHYIQIKTTAENKTYGFLKGNTDNTDYTDITEELTKLSSSGGRRRTRRRKIKRSKRSKYSRRYR